MRARRQVGKDAVVIEADAIKNRDVLFKHLSSSDFGRHDPMLSTYVHEYSTKAAEMMLVFAGAPAMPPAASEMLLSNGRSSLLSQQGPILDRIGSPSVKH